MIAVQGLRKTFTLHNQGGVELPVLQGIDLEVQPGECVALDGPSGAGKSTLLKCLYANYRATAGSVRVGDIGVTAASERELLALRRDTIGYVSQFLRVVPRVPALEVVMEPLHGAADARQRAEHMLLRLRSAMSACCCVYMLLRLLAAASACCCVCLLLQAAANAHAAAETAAAAAAATASESRHTWSCAGGLPAAWQHGSLLHGFLLHGSTDPCCLASCCMAARIPAAWLPAAWQHGSLLLGFLLHGSTDPCCLASCCMAARIPAAWLPAA